MEIRTPYDNKNFILESIWDVFTTNNMHMIISWVLVTIIPLIMWISIDFDQKVDTDYVILSKHIGYIQNEEIYYFNISDDIVDKEGSLSTIEVSEDTYLSLNELDVYTKESITKWQNIFHLYLISSVISVLFIEVDYITSDRGRYTIFN